MIDIPLIGEVEDILVYAPAIVGLVIAIWIVRKARGNTHTGSDEVSADYGSRTNDEVRLEAKRHRIWDLLKGNFNRFRKKAIKAVVDTEDEMKLNEQKRALLRSAQDDVDTLQQARDHGQRQGILTNLEIMLAGVNAILEKKYDKYFKWKADERGLRRRSSQAYRKARLELRISRKERKLMKHEKGSAGMKKLEEEINSLKREKELFKEQKEDEKRIFGKLSAYHKNLKLQKDLSESAHKTIVKIKNMENEIYAIEDLGKRQRKVENHTVKTHEFARDLSRLIQADHDEEGMLQSIYSQEKEELLATKKIKHSLTGGTLEGLAQVA